MVCQLSGVTAKSKQGDVRKCRLRFLPLPSICFFQICCQKHCCQHQKGKSESFQNHCRPYLEAAQFVRRRQGPEESDTQCHLQLLPIVPQKKIRLGKEPRTCPHLLLPTAPKRQLPYTHDSIFPFLIVASCNSAQ